MAGEIQVNSVTALTESSSNIVLNNVNTAANRTNLGLGSMATQASGSIDIDGGAIDGTVIGASSAAEGTFTTFTSTGIDDNASSTAITINTSGRIQHNTGGSEITTGGGSPQYSINYSSNTGPGLRIQDTSAQNGNTFISFINAGTVAGSITTNGSTSTTYGTGSDYRLKENITNITDGISRVKQLNPSRFNFTVDPNRIVDGFIAHEVSDIVPEAISGEKDAVNEDGSINLQMIDQSKLVPLLTAALQESIALIESQQSQIDALTARIEALETS